MSNKDQLLLQVTSGPRNVRLKELRKLMTSYGFKEKKTSHGYMYRHEKLIGVKMPYVAKPHGREPKVLEVYVYQCIDAIEMLQQKEMEK